MFQKMIHLSNASEFAAGKKFNVAFCAALA